MPLFSLKSKREFHSEIITFRGHWYRFCFSEARPLLTLSQQAAAGQAAEGHLFPKPF